MLFRAAPRRRGAAAPRRRGAAEVEPRPLTRAAVARVRRGRRGLGGLRPPWTPLESLKLKISYWTKTGSRNQIPDSA